MIGFTTLIINPNQLRHQKPGSPTAAPNSPLRATCSAICDRDTRKMLAMAPKMVGTATYSHEIVRKRMINSAKPSIVSDFHDFCFYMLLL